MKISDFLPTTTPTNKVELYNQILPWFDEFQKSSKTSIPAPEVGIEMLYMDWLRTAYAYRRMLIQDLCLVAFDIAEVRACIMVRRNEVFRKGFDEWEPRFVVKCVNCGKEFQTVTEHCDECFATEVQFQGYEDELKINDDGTQEIIKNPIYKTVYSRDENGDKLPSQVRSPDLAQVSRFEDFKRCANTFGQSLEDVLRQTMEFTYIADDGYILRSKEYFFDDNKLTGSKISEVRALHPALVEFDLDKNGLAKKSHWICLEHRDTVRDAGGPCLECGKDTLPVMYVYNHRGKKVYLTENELIHISVASPSTIYGYCFEKDTEVLTDTGFKFIDNITKDDNVATLNQVKNTLEYQKPIALTKNLYTGKMINVENKNVSLSCTPNHRVYADRGNGWEKFEAKELLNEKIVHFSRTSDWVGEEKDYFTLPEYTTMRLRKSKPVELSLYQWYKLLGCYMATGSHKVLFGGAAVKNKIRSCLTECGVSFSENEFRKGKISFSLSNERLVESLKEAVGVTVSTRTLDYIKTLSIPAQRIVADTALELSTDVLWSKFKVTNAYKALVNISNNINSIEQKKELNKTITLNGTSTVSEFKKYPEKKILMDTWCEFLGYYLSEGSTYIVKNQHGYIVQIAQEKPDYLVDIQNCLDKLPFKWRRVKSGWLTSDVQLGNYLTQFGKSRDKHVPQDIKALSKRQLNIILSALEKGDGSRGYYYYTTSKQLRDDFQEIALKCGLSTKVANRVKSDCYELEIQRSFKRNIKIDCKRDVTEKEFNDFVYCCQVPNDIIFIRRHGKTYWSCNSLLLSIMQKALTLSGMDRCFAADTDVLTKSGWKSASIVDYNDEIATVSKDNIIEYQKPTYVHSYYHSGKMYSLKTNNIDLFTTPKHRMLVRKPKETEYSFKEAQDIEGQQAYYLRGGLSWLGNEKEYFTLPSCAKNKKGAANNLKDVQLNSSSWMSFLGYWYACGYTTSKNIVLSVANNLQRDTIKKEIITLPISWNVDGRYIEGGNAVINNFLTQFNTDKTALLTVISEQPEYAKHQFYAAATAVLDNFIPKTHIMRYDILKDALYAFRTSFNGCKTGNDYNVTIPIPVPKIHVDKLIAMDLWLEFLGYWLSEGSVTGLTVQVAQKPGHKKETIRKCLYQLPFKWRDIEGGFICSNKQLSTYLRQFGKSKDKFVPEDIKQLSTRQLNIIFNALMLGDGHKDIKYTTASTKLRDDMMELALKIGKSVCFYPLKDKRGYKCDMLSLSNYNNPVVNKTKKQDNMVDWKGQVYCVEVPNTSLIVRRNGKVVVTGNTLYRYFFERKTPSGIILTYTDDPQSLEVARSRVESKMMEDPTYIPWVAVSQKTGRGRTDFVRLFHTLQEMDYLPVRNEIRERIAMMFGVPPLWQSDTAGMGGLGGQSVSGKTPVWIRRNNKFIDLVPIESLHHSPAHEYKNFPKDLEVLSQDGWTKIKHIWRHRTKEDYLLGIELGGAFAETTIDHSLMQNKQEIKASELKEGDSIDVIDAPKSEEFNSMTEDFAWFLGFYAAEGSFCFEKTGVRVSNTDGKLLERSKNILEAHYNKPVTIDFHMSTKSIKPCGEAHIYGKEIANDIRALCYCFYNKIDSLNSRPVFVPEEIKKVPMQVLNGSLEIKKAFIMGYIAGDGSVEHNAAYDSYKTVSVSQTLSAGVEYLATCLGNEINVHFVGNRLISDKWNNAYRISFSVGKRAKINNEIKKIIKIPVDNDNKFVYDIETESHTFVGGIGYVVFHNSRQLEMFSRVVESDQRLINEKVIPLLLADFGITDWKIKVKTPEDKTEEARMSLVTQKIQAANVLFTMGFDIELAENKGAKIDDLNFKVSGKAKRPEMPIMGPGGVGNAVMGADQATVPLQEGEGETKPVANTGEAVEEDVQALMNKATNKTLPFGTRFDRTHGLHNATDKHANDPKDKFNDLQKEFSDYETGINPDKKESINVKEETQSGSNTETGT